MLSRWANTSVAKDDVKAPQIIRYLGKLCQKRNMLWGLEDLIYHQELRMTIKWNNH